jgi:hypothetical protein
VLKALRVSALVRRCRLTVSEPVLKSPMVSALATSIFKFNLRRYRVDGKDVYLGVHATEVGWSRLNR